MHKRAGTTNQSVSRSHASAGDHDILKPYHEVGFWGYVPFFVWFLEVGSLEGLSKRPAGRGGINALTHIAVTRDHLEGESLVLHLAVSRKLPHLTPVSSHGLIGIHGGAPHIQLLNVTSATNIGDKHKQEVRVSIDGVPNPSSLGACHPANQASN